MDNIKDIMNKLHLEHPYSYHYKIKKDNILYNELLKKYGNIPIKEMMFCVLNDAKPNEICKYGNTRIFCKSNSSSGYSRCNLKSKCKCHNEQKMEKAKQSNIDKYGVEFTFQADDVKEKIKQTNKERYGVENVSNNKNIKEKIKKTNLDRYGTMYPMQNHNVVDKAIQTNLEKYGVENPSQTYKIKEKTKQSNFEKYGVEYIFQIDDVKEKIKQTNLKKYGVLYSVKNPSIIKKRKQTNFEMFYSKINERVNNMYTPLFDITGYHGTSNDGKGYNYSWKCNTCDNIFNGHLLNGRTPRCPTCYPNNQSKWELEIQNYIKGYIDIETNTYSVINPLELDIYIPSKNIAIECNGSYWHSEFGGKDSTYHLNKTELCDEQHIQLLHIWEHEYNNKPNLIKSMIKAKLGLNNRIYARKTQIQVVDNKTKDLFLDNNHLQGTCTSTHSIGLYCNNKLVALMTFGKPRFNKKYEWELIRYCSKQNTNVVGGASKLFKYFIKNYNPKDVISYADRRFSNGNMYKQLGFNFIENSSPNFKYTKDYKIMHNRLKFQKHKLKDQLDIFDEDLTEKQNMINAGYTRLWDCGNSVWEWKK